jgi:hypothetical protein
LEQKSYWCSIWPGIAPALKCKCTSLILVRLMWAFCLRSISVFRSQSAWHWFWAWVVVVICNLMWVLYKIIIIHWSFRGVDEATSFCSCLSVYTIDVFASAPSQICFVYFLSLSEQKHLNNGYSMMYKQY